MMIIFRKPLILVAVFINNFPFSIMEEESILKYISNMKILKF